MTLATMRLRVAEALTILADDGSTIKEGVVTILGITNRINDIYREELFPLFSSKYPEDFTQNTFPANTYTVSAVVDAASTGTTLVLTTTVADNSMVGFKIQNGSTLATVTVTGYTNTTTLTVDSSITSWIGATIYVLGNEYSFGGSTTDLKEIIQFNIKYKSTDQFLMMAENRNYRDVVKNGGANFSAMDPMWYRTTLKINGLMTPGFGVLPYPSEYTGQYQFSYTQRPAALGETDEPIINTAGISECLINGAIAWGQTLMSRPDQAMLYMQFYEKGKHDIISNYRPRNRSGATKVRHSDFMSAMGRRYV